VGLFRGFDVGIHVLVGLEWNKVHYNKTLFVGPLHQPWMMDDDDDYGAISGMNKCSEKYCLSAAVTTTDLTHDLSRARTRATAVGSRHLTA
jgi:hypothetical protein